MRIILLVSVFLFVSSLKAKERPNIVILFADDLGVTDLACYGAEYGNTYHETPHIDALAKQGMRFSDAYAASPVCSPTRASILTGKYPARLKLTDFIPGQIQPQFKRASTMRLEQQFLDPGERTFAHALKEGGYSTWFFGKWHLGKGTPADFGFEQEYGAQTSEHKRFYPFIKQKNLKGKPGDYVTDVMSQQAVECIAKQREQWDRGQKKPFLLYMSYYLVHMPIKARQEAIDYFTQKKKSKHWKRADYAAMLKILDDSVGTLMKALDDYGFADNTMVVFYSDNGGHKCTSNHPFRAHKGSLYEGGIRVPLIVKWPAKISPHSKSSELVNTPDIFPSLLETANLALEPQNHLDGQSFYPALITGKVTQGKAIFWHHPHYRDNATDVPASVIRQGDYKLIRHYDTGKYELFNLAKDPAETNDLSQLHPRLVIQLRKKLDAWLKNLNASVPHKNSAYDPEKAKDELWGGPMSVKIRQAERAQQEKN